MSVTLFFYSFSRSKSFRVFLLQISTVCLYQKDDFIKPTLRFLSLDIGCLLTSRGLILRISVVNLAKANITDGYLACVPVSIHDLPGCRWKLMRDCLVVFYSTERDCRGEKRRRLEERDQIDSKNTDRLMGILCLHSVLTGKLSFGKLFRTAQVVEVWVQILVKQQPGLHLWGQRRVIDPAHQKTTTATWQKSHRRKLDHLDTSEIYSFLNKCCSDVSEYWTLGGELGCFATSVKQIWWWTKSVARKGRGETVWVQKGWTIHDYKRNLNLDLFQSTRFYNAI